MPVVASKPENPPEDRSVSMLGANLLVVLATGPLVAALALAFAVRWGGAALALGVWGLLDPAVLLLAVLPGILAHELLHALGWAISARRPLSAICIGVNWRGLSPYAHLKEPMPARAYRIGAALPALVMGLLPAGVAIVLGKPLLMAWSLFFLFTAGGDFVVLWLIRDVEAGRLVQDHPTRAGCQVLDPPLDDRSVTP
jgi:hypothetical protein